VKIERRHVLAAMAGTAAAGAAGVGTVAFTWWDPVPGQGLKVLSQHEYEVIQSLAEAWMPRGGTPELSGADAELGRFLDGMLQHMPPLETTGLKLLIQALDDGTLLTEGATFHSLSLDRRSQLLAEWLSSRNTLLRSAVMALMALMAMGWTTHPEVVVYVNENFQCRFGL